ncbi:hypothetical protein NQZ79_g2240 [Umbelopsis isabellina]|nr:hypothetical protein NQZ79_g2240 [Umbelopsis isabellina]
MQKAAVKLQRPIIKDSPEILEPITASFVGQLPSWMNGTLFRIGPGKFNFQRNDGSYMHIRHAFDGMPYMHRLVFSADKNQVDYNSRNLSKEIDRKLSEDPNYEPLFFGHHHDTATNLFVKLFRAYKRLRSMNIPIENRDPNDAMVGVTPTPNFPIDEKHFSDVHKVGDKVLVSKTDANILQLLDAESLEPKKLFSYTTLIPEVKGQMSAAHHQTCPITNELFNIVLSLGQSTSIKIISLSPDGKGTQYGEVKKRLNDGSPISPPYIHSFPLTKNYVIIPEYPLYFGGKGLPFIMEGNIEAAFRWDEKAKTYFHIISRDKKEHVATIEADPAFSFHMGNAWESENGIEFECCVFPDGDIVQQLYSFGNPLRKSQAKTYATKDAGLTSNKVNGITNPPIRQPSFGNLRRYTISYGAIASGHGEASARDIASNVEFPRFNTKYSSKPSRYIWGCALEAATVEKNETYDVVKIDTNNGDITRYHRPGYACSEPIFVPKPGGIEEDDGVIVALANEFGEEEEMVDRSHVVVLDGKTLEELGKATIGDFTPVTFHGSFVDKDFVNVSIN